MGHSIDGCIVSKFGLGKLGEVRFLSAGRVD